MSTETDMTDVCDRLQDHTRAVLKLAKAVETRRDPVVNVAAPNVSLPAPTMKAPDVNVAAPTVNVQPQKPQKWKHVICRDKYGKIESVESTPQ